MSKLYPEWDAYMTGRPLVVERNGGRRPLEDRSSLALLFRALALVVAVISLVAQRGWS